MKAAPGLGHYPPFSPIWPDWKMIYLTMRKKTNPHKPDMTLDPSILSQDKSKLASLSGLAQKSPSSPPPIQCGSSLELKDAQHKIIPAQSCCHSLVPALLLQPPCEQSKLAGLNTGAKPSQSPTQPAGYFPYQAVMCRGVGGTVFFRFKQTKHKK